LNLARYPTLTLAITYVKYQKKDSWWTKAVVIFAILLNAGITVYLWVSYLLDEFLASSA